MKIIDIEFCTIGHSFLLTNQVRSVNISFREADESARAPCNCQKYGWICLPGVHQDLDEFSVVFRADAM